MGRRTTKRWVYEKNGIQYAVYTNETPNLPDGASNLHQDGYWDAKTCSIVDAKNLVDYSNPNQFQDWAYERMKHAK